MMDTPLIITLLCDGDKVTSAPRLKDNARLYTVGELIKRYKEWSE